MTSNTRPKACSLYRSCCVFQKVTWSSRRRPSSVRVVHTSSMSWTSRRKTRLWILLLLRHTRMQRPRTARYLQYSYCHITIILCTERVKYTYRHKTVKHMLNRKQCACFIKTRVRCMCVFKSNPLIIQNP